jgi:opacity protein-like surface antigen
MQKRWAVIFALLAIAAPAGAQSVKPIDVNVGFGWMFPSGQVKDRWDAGWNGGIGVTFNINERWGILSEYKYTKMTGPSKAITLFPTPVDITGSSGVIESNHQMHIGDFDLVYKLGNPSHPLGGYVLAGGGIYHRIVQLTTPSVGYTSICDPYWYVCYPALVSVDQIIGDRSSNDFGMDFGGGVTFGTDVKFYIESKYHYVWGPTVTAPTSGGATTCSSGCSTNASYYPLTFGVKW